MSIKKSSLVTAPSGTKMRQYILNGVNGKVNEGEVIVNKKANELYKNIYKTYTKLNKYFQEIGKEYRRCATQSVKGDNLVSALKKVAKNCENQGQYCLNKQKKLKKLFKMSITKNNVSDLEVAVTSQFTATATATSVAGVAGASKAKSNTVNSGTTATPKVAAKYTPGTKEFKQKQKEGDAIRQAEFKADTKTYQEIQARNKAKTSPTTITGAAKSVVAKAASTTSKTTKKHQ